MSITQPHLDDGDDRLDEAFADFLESAERGEPLRTEQFVVEYPELDETVRVYEDFDRMTAPVRDLMSTIERESTPAEPLPAGARIGDYELLEVIGIGGMGIVYRARHLKIATMVVALKMISSDVPATEEQRRRFLTEVKNQATLDHPNILPVLGGGEHEGQLYFTMKLVEGGDLRQYMSEQDVLPQQAARLAAQMARAVHHAHQRNILHRDLKPSNGLLDAKGEPYVADFGLAKLVADNEGVDTVYFVGAPAFVAPEQIDGRATTLTDVYGLGTILYWLLTGRPPFEGPSLEMTLRQVREEAPRPPREVRPGLDHWKDRYLELICLKCLAKDPEQRYASADASAVDLERWLDDKPPLGVPVSPRDRLRFWLTRQPGVAGLVAGTAVLLVVSAVMANLAAQHMESRLLTIAGQSNTRAAERVADNIRWLLRDLSRHVSRTSESAAVRTLLSRTADVQSPNQVREFLASPQGRDLLQQVRNQFKEHNEQLGQDGIPAFATMFFMNEHGRLVAHASSTRGDLSVIGSLFNLRDYFVTAKEYAAQQRRDLSAVHVSRVFHSKFDGYFKFSISVPVLDEQGEFIGAIAASIPMHHTFGLSKELLHGDDQKVVLVGRVDRNSPSEEDHSWPLANLDYNHHVLLHEAFEASEALRRLPIPHPGEQWPARDPTRPELSARPHTGIDPDADYTDPLSRFDSQQYGGRWLAGFAAVGNTELMVIVQQRFEEAVGRPVALAAQFVWWGWGTLALASILAAGLLWHRHREATSTERPIPHLIT